VRERIASRIDRHLWQGSSQRALGIIYGLDVPLDNHKADKLIVHKYGKLKSLRRYLADLDPVAGAAHLQEEARVADKLAVVDLPEYAFVRSAPP